jgi:hypothetical protein
MAPDSELTERLILQLRDDVTAGFAHTARATDLSRVEGQLQAYQAETDRRLDAIEQLEHARHGGFASFRFIGGAIAFLVSNGALWAAVLLRHP